MIRIEHLKKEYEVACPLKDINLTINKGDAICLIGPSGTGKSTLLRMINLLETPTSGKIFLNDEEITAPGFKKEIARRKMAMVFQNFNLFNHLSVIENLVIPQVDLLGISKDKAFNKALALLESVGLREQYLSYPTSLSGGQKQRVAIARALSLEPEVILFDEPTSALDPIMVNEVETIMIDLAKKGQTMIIVTHDMNLAERVSNRVIYLDQGEVYEDDTPEVIFHHPKRSRTRAFVENLSVLKLSIHNNFNHLDCENKLEKFIKDLRINEKDAYKLRVIYDELLYTLLVKDNNCKDVLLLISYDTTKHFAYIDCKYSGDVKNILKNNNISSKIIMNNISSVKHQEIDEKKYTNQLKFKTK